jgi:predicted nucleic acid-binding protein
VILTDAGPLVALLNRRDPYHERCVAASRLLGDEPMLTTLPCFGEAMYLLGAAGGYPLQAALWNLRSAGDLFLHEMTAAELDRAEVLMEKFNDSPMDFGDASLVAVAESRALRQVFTLDRHFWGYRMADGSTLEPIPGR